MLRINRTVIFALIALLLVVSTNIFAQGQAWSASKGAPIRLRAGTFTPSAGERPNIPLQLTRAPDADDQPGYYIVQFSGAIRQEWKDALTDMGATTLDYIPDNALKVRMTAGLAASLDNIDVVAWVGAFEPAYVLSPDLAPPGSSQLVRVSVEPGGDAQAILAMAIQLGAQASNLSANTLLVAADRAQIEQLAIQGRDVAWVEPYTLFEMYNEYGGGTIIGGATANANGYDGSTQIAAVADSGLGGGTAATAHRDIPASRIVAIQNFPGATDFCFKTILDDGAVDVNTGHGTHVAGSVLSGGTPGTGVGKGVAPAARLVFQAVESYVDVATSCSAYPDGYYLTGVSDLNGLFLQAYTAGARIHANSWGSNTAGDYTVDSVDTDAFVWGHKDLTITFAAGNEGADATGNGVVDNDSIGSPGTAKNVITIGASENNRQSHYECDTGLTYVSTISRVTCSMMSGNNLTGNWDITSGTTADNAQQMADFSSRGPTDDGRIKPDVVAPGTWIISTYSDMYQQGYDATPNPRTGFYQDSGWGIPLNAYYKYFSGTSMANPIAAGGATVVRDFYQKAYSTSASAALVKATLINSAVDLLDENNDGANDNDIPIPNVHEGWGRIDLATATDGKAVFVDNTTGLSTGGTYSASYTAPGGQPLKVTLVWSDYPSTAAAALNLVNNLNLTLSGPGGVSYKGNVFSGGWSATSGAADTVNNVENVYVQSAAAGSWTVTVTGASVPQGPQPFALVVRGAGVLVPSSPSSLVATATSNSQINLSWTASSGLVNLYKVERCQGAGCSSFAQVGTATTTSFSDNGLTLGTGYSYRVRAANSGGDSEYSNIASATTASGNHAPEASGVIPNQTAILGQPFSYTFASAAFVDADAGDILTYSATAGGAALPAWLSFNPATRTFSGTPIAANLGALTITVTAEDGAGATASSSFTLTIVEKFLVYLPLAVRSS